jgi:hypothetical protein
MFKNYKVVIILSALLLLSYNSRAQEAIAIDQIVNSDEEITVRDISKVNQAIIISDTLNGWDYSWVGGLNGSQASYSNWSQGGVNTISVTSSTVFDALYRNGRYGYGLSTNLKYGKARIAGDGARKTDDRIAINNKFSYRFADERWNAFANINFSTQFDQGFDYDVADDEDGILISEFFAPAYFTQIAGIGYVPNDYFTADAGLAMKQTVVLNDSLSTRYGLNTGDNFRFEPGYALGVGFEKEIFKNLELISSLETFTNLQRHIDRTDITFTNELIGTINKFLNMSLQFVVVYNDDFSKQAQIKQVLSAGLSFSIL